MVAQRSYVAPEEASEPDTAGYCCGCDGHYAGHSGARDKDCLPWEEGEWWWSETAGAAVVVGEQHKRVQAGMVGKGLLAAAGGIAAG